MENKIKKFTREEIEQIVKDANKMTLNITERTLGILAKLHELEEKIDQIFNK